jgi:hydrogenase maturation factor
MSKHLMTKDQFDRISTAPDYHTLRMIAEEVLPLIPNPVGMVCGPISPTGGLMDLQANKDKFNLAIKTLTNIQIPLFDQMQFEGRMEELHEPIDNGYDVRILQDFYDPIFQSGWIKRKFFIPGWETSRGSVWERQTAAELGIDVFDLDENLLPIW